MSTPSLRRVSEKLVFSTNIPETVALKFATGKQVDSQYSEEAQTMFSTVDGRVFFATPALADKIAELGLAPREPFTVLKKESRGSGPGKSYTEWIVSREQVLDTPAPETTPTPTSKAPNGSSLRSNVTQLPIDRAMLACLLAAGRATHAASELLENEGATIRFSSRDVSALATTMLIHAGREGLLTWLDPEPATATPVRMPAASEPKARTWKSAQIACRTRGELKAAFAQLREAVGEVEYEKEMNLAGVADPTHFRDAARAYASYDRLVQIATETV